MAGNELYPDPHVNDACAPGPIPLSRTPRGVGGPGSNWLRYSGEWGAIGAAASVPFDVIAFTTGPPGSAYRSG